MLGKIQNDAMAKIEWYVVDSYGRKLIPVKPSDYGIEGEKFIAPCGCSLTWESSPPDGYDRTIPIPLHATICLDHFNYLSSIFDSKNWSLNDSDVLRLVYVAFKQGYIAFFTRI